MLPVCKLPFPNGSYRNGVCRTLWALLYLNLHDGMNSFLETSDTLEDIKKNQAIAFLAPNPDLLEIISIEEKKSAKEKKIEGFSIQTIVLCSLACLLGFRKIVK